jgi:sulfite reductase (ferredoxin)
VACPAPLASDARAEVMEYAKRLSDRLKPRSRAYYEIWLDGEKAASLEEHEPLYGDTYLPRKFKIAFGAPGDNCVDAYTQDIGIVPVVKSRLEGFTLLVGGGLGQSHGAKDTHPVLGKPLTTIAPGQLFEVVEAIIKVQRDNGRRDDRKFSRMKYLVEAWGIEKFKAEVEKYYAQALPQPQPLEWLSGDDHLGWQEQGDGKLFFGLFVENGRIKENIRSAIKEVVLRFKTEVRLTPQQNILFVDIAPADQAAIEATFRNHGLALPGSIPLVVQNAMACPAMPTCGLAITEAERVMPDITREIDLLLNKLELQDGPIPYMRMTGCPNGCARPYSAEVGLVGRSLGSYTIYLGGSHLGTRLGQVFADNIKREDIVGKLEPVLTHYKKERLGDEAFGDFCHRVGLETLKEKASAVSA